LGLRPRARKDTFFPAQLQFPPYQKRFCDERTALRAQHYIECPIVILARYEDGNVTVLGRTISLIVSAALVLMISSICSSLDARGQEMAASHIGSKPQHVFIIVLENAGFETTFGRKSPAPYLSRELAAKGLLLTQYYAIGHFSLDNYIAMISGQGPNSYTQNDCFMYYDFRPFRKELDANGQALGAGCVYPDSVLTIGNQLEAKHLVWKGYMGTWIRTVSIQFPDKSIDISRQARSLSTQLGTIHLFTFIQLLIIPPVRSTWCRSQNSAMT